MHLTPHIYTHIQTDIYVEHSMQRCSAAVSFSIAISVFSYSCSNGFNFNMNSNVCFVVGDAAPRLNCCEIFAKPTHVAFCSQLATVTGGALPFLPSAFTFIMIAWHFLPLSLLLLYCFCLFFSFSTWRQLLVYKVYKKLLFIYKNAIISWQWFCGHAHTYIRT